MPSIRLELLIRRLLSAKMIPLLGASLRESFIELMGENEARQLPSMRSLPWGSILVGCILLAVVYEQLIYIYRRWRYNYKGPLFVIPFLGGIVEMGGYLPRSLSGRNGGHCHAGIVARWESGESFPSAPHGLRIIRWHGNASAPPLFAQQSCGVLP